MQRVLCTLRRYSTLKNPKSYVTTILCIKLHFRYTSFNSVINNKASVFCVGRLSNITCRQNSQELHAQHRRPIAHTTKPVHPTLHVFLRKEFFSFTKLNFTKVVLRQIASLTQLEKNLMCRLNCVYSCC